VNDMAMRAFWRATHFKRVYERSILLTGGTGFLLDQILKNDDIDIVYCLVRATSHGEAAHRSQSALQVFAGDTSLHHLGLDDDDYAMLGTGVDLVVHCAALVNLVYPAIRGIAIGQCSRNSKPH
jgi:thioester reductase-like protein